ncbi:MAG: fused MFS/spermidine synthase [Hyphomicrobiaceae bacterium]|nr:fused MFS/spermidine synthase [Hyphomicrobiaceae bacterium]
MTTAALRTMAEGGSRLARSHGLVLWLYAATMFLSALLLFSIQPLFAKMILPTLGGSPSVWAVSLCFFQAALLAGYGYAHVLNHFAKPQYAPFIHIALMAIAALMLPFGLPANMEPPTGDAYFWLIGVLTIGVGLPFFAVSANAPLLQAWYARSGHPHARDPYFLYGASNLGSLLALLSYPVLIEPLLGLGQQADIWTGGYFLLAAAIASCGYLLVSSWSRPAEGDFEAAKSEAEAAPVTWAARASWTLYAFVPSGLLVAFTSYVTTDIASAPFLWVTPLAAFLLTFVLVFRERPLVPYRALLVAQPILFTTLLLTISAPKISEWVALLLLHAPLFLVTTLICHKQLYDARPASAHLTQFYLLMSFGGVLGGIFAAIVAPQIFNSTYEYPLLLLIGIACRPDVQRALYRTASRAAARNTAIISASLVLVFLVVNHLTTGLTARATGLVVIIISALFMYIDRKQTLAKLVHAAAMVAAVSILPSSINRGYSERSFFGVVRVADSNDGKLRLLMHGTTVHGAEHIADLAPGVTTAPRAVTYYYAGSPMREGVDAARKATGKLDGGLNAGVVGLGAGSMACAAKANENWRFYEIDPVVVKVAMDPKQFTFMTHCMPKPDMVMGDARLTLAREPKAKFDYLLIDAFSSDTVPVHLMTREAFLMFLDKVAPDGILAMHVSNRYMDLVSVLASTIPTIPGAHAAIAVGKPARSSLESIPSKVVFVSRSEKALGEVLAWPDALPLKATDVAPWTDDYSNVVSAIWRLQMQN